MCVRVGGAVRAMCMCVCAVRCVLRAVGCLVSGPCRVMMMMVPRVARVLVAVRVRALLLAMQLVAYDKLLANTCANTMC